ncbi:anhydro-N-acetylmuramic acid kinase [Granulicella cerasi]|uniref:Anhydro-N-acetylmuramic acid kinase n=1 Tax=Granulicella cerasi TaxID=741063 RepID=A0ABW1ZCU6_9BACT|nr:anhydro-N-acetylmuramic acid kinase [Granulicella cerasi]
MKQAVKPKSMVVAGVMSGTSADGIDVAVCRVSFDAKTQLPKLKLLAHRAFPYSAAVRKSVLAAMNAASVSVAELSQLSWRLGALYADAVEATLQDAALNADLVAIHGQTIYHQSTATKFLGAPTRSTWQMGEPSVVAERLRLPVLSDFRPADLAAGGQGAPLVPMLDYVMFRHATRNRVLLNLGGIANVTAIPAAAQLDDVMAFDTGPANMVIDALMAQFTGKAFDRNGTTARRGKVLEQVLKPLLAMPYFDAAPPKSCGREQFGVEFVERFRKACELPDASHADCVATATAFTAQTIVDAYVKFVWPHLGQSAPLAKSTELLVAGGGARNATLMQMLADRFAFFGVRVKTTEDVGLPIEAKEAAAFALLGWLTWHKMPGNVRTATGAAREVVLGKVTYA